MKAVVVDTNVAIVANDAVKRPDDPEVRPPECIEACIDTLLAITRDGHLVLDAGGLIFAEYAGRLSFAGQPGTGDLFMKWVSDRQWDTKVCSRVEITIDDDRGFVEFPEDSALAEFDADDRKFVAVAATHEDRPPILQAVDYEWKNWEEALSAAGITLRFLCPS